MKKYAVIVAGGTGSRYGSKTPKQFLELNGFPMLWWSLYAFWLQDPETGIILVLPEEYLNEWKEIEKNIKPEYKVPHQVISGGKTRTESVKRGLSLIPDDEESLVAVHDAARPLLTLEIIEEGWSTAESYGASIPVVPVTDSLRFLNDNGSEAVDRDRYVSVQTPQVFKTSYLKDAYEKNNGDTFSDDASAVEKSGRPISLFQGSPTNIKVTNPGDIEWASKMMKKKDASFS